MTESREAPLTRKRRPGSETPLRGGGPWRRILEDVQSQEEIAP